MIKPIKRVEPNNQTPHQKTAIKGSGGLDMVNKQLHSKNTNYPKIEIKDPNKQMNDRQKLDETISIDDPNGQTNDRQIMPMMKGITDPNGQSMDGKFPMSSGKSKGAKQKD